MVASDLLRQNSHESRSIHDVETPRSENAISAFSIPRVARDQSRILSEAPPPNLAGRKYECNAPSCSKSFGRLSELKYEILSQLLNNTKKYTGSIVGYIKTEIAGLTHAPNAPAMKGLCLQKILEDTSRRFIMPML